MCHLARGALVCGAGLQIAFTLLSGRAAAQAAAPAKAVEFPENLRSRGAAGGEPQAGPDAGSLVGSDEPDEPDEPIAEVVVSGERRAPSRGASDYQISVGKLAAVPHMDSASLLRLAPGVMLTNEGGLGHPYQIFLRGFDAREGQDIELSVDGVPVNEVGNPHGNGLADTHFIIPELVQNLRVVEGPFAPQQGNFAVAGSALYELGLPTPALTLQAMAGSFDTQRLLVLWRPDGSADHTFGGAELFTTAGFGQNRAAHRATAMAGYEGALGESASFRLLATSYASHYGQAGLLRLDDVQAERKGYYDTYDTSQGGDSARHSLGVTLDGHVGSAALRQAAFLTLRDFRLRENLTGFQEDPQQTWQALHVQRGDLIDQRARQFTLGARGSARQTWKVFDRDQDVEFGYFARYDQVDAVQQRNRSGTNIPYRKDLDLASGLTNIGLYLDTSVRPLPWVTLRGGLRADLYHYLVTNRCALSTQNSFGGDPLDTECFSSDRVGYRSPDQTASTSASLLEPRATVIIGPFHGFELTASYGRGSRSLDPQYINQDLATPFATVDAYEVGAAYSLTLEVADLTLHSVLFQTHVDKDLFFNETEGRNTLANGTTRTGWAVSGRATGAFWDVAANLTLVESSFDDTGLAVPYAPTTIARGDGVVFGDLPIGIAGSALTGSVGAGASFIGPRPLPFNEESVASFLVDMGASIRWRALSLGLILTNLLDRRYPLGEYNYASDFRSRAYPTLVAARHFSAAEPRAGYVTLTVTLENAGTSP
jgi:iron complex outermembrane receptor protein